MASSIYSLASTSAMLLVLVFLCSTSRSDVDIPPSLSPFLGSFESCMLVPPPPTPSIPDNVSFFDRAIGPDCRRLGVRPSDATTRSTPDESSQGIRFPSGSFHCIGVIVMSLALINWL
ncbi:hypothetical protein R6Q57_000826 [Mikania cordata]